MDPREWRQSVQKRLNDHLDRAIADVWSSSGAKLSDGNAPHVGRSEHASRCTKANAIHRTCCSTLCQIHGWRVIVDALLR